MSAKTLTDSAASRYASAIFELAIETKSLDKAESDLDLVANIYESNGDFRKVVKSAIFSREQQVGVIKALGKKIKLSDLTIKSLCLMAQKRRLFSIESMVEHFKRLASDHRGEIKVNITSASKLSRSQEDEIRNFFEEETKSSVILNIKQDESLIGGLLIKVGSNLIDSSIRSQLINVENKMKEVGL